MAKRFIAMAVLFFCVATGTAWAQAVATLSGTLSALVAELTSDDYFLRSASRDPRPYVDPQPALGTLFRAAKLLDYGQVDQAAALASEAGYEVVRFVDRQSRHEYLVLREDLKSVKQPRGWGAYLLNPNSEVPAIVEVPHPLDDANTATVGALVFAEGARGLLIAGAQRDKADVPDLVDSVFHQIHVAWTGPWGKVAAWQIHGFAIEKHPFPDNAKAILSTGGGEVIDEIVTLNDQLTERGIDGYAFNRLKAEDEVNQRINNGQPGVRFSSLAATKNEQGRHLRSIGGAFVHVELERAVRNDADQRRVAAEAIATSIVSSAGILPNPTRTARDQAPTREARRRPASGRSA
jgi:hypothetical protein